MMNKIKTHWEAITSNSKPHAWLCLGCKKFELTPTSARPKWVNKISFREQFEHYYWISNIINDQDFGEKAFCGRVKRVLAKEI